MGKEAHKTRYFLKQNLYYTKVPILGGNIIGQDDYDDMEDKSIATLYAREGDEFESLGGHEWAEVNDSSVRMSDINMCQDIGEEDIGRGQTLDFIHDNFRVKRSAK